MYQENDFERRSGGRKRARERKKKTWTIVCIILAAAILLGLICWIVLKNRATDLPVVNTTEEGETLSGESDESSGQFTGQFAEILEKADRMAQGYDYDGAVAYIKSQVPNYESVTELSDFASNAMAKKSQLVKWRDNTNITHIFFHTLIMDQAVAFKSYEAEDYNQVMTTIGEFKTILQQMYDRGYVLVRLSDIASIDPKTNQMTYNAIYLPQGKKPFVLSQDDVCYYEYMKETGGYANRLIVTDDGKVMNEVDNPDGTKTVGAFDVCPILDEFVEAHPDFSYHGAKGILALTGYNGILGYRTSEIAYGAGDPNWPKAHVYDNPNIDADREAAKKVAEAIRANGWDFASHTWGHMNMSTVVDGAGNYTERLPRDTTWWKNEVESLIGDTDIIIFAYGADIGSWRNYSNTNQAYMYLKQAGFNYFCNVDSSKSTWVQMSPDAGGSGYLRQGRRNIDGQLMFKSMVYPEKKILDDIIDVWTVFDFTRPLPVKGVTIPEGMSILTKPDGTTVQIK